MCPRTIGQVKLHLIYANLVLYSAKLIWIAAFPRDSPDSQLLIELREPIIIVGLVECRLFRIIILEGTNKQKNLTFTLFCYSLPVSRLEYAFP